VRSPSNRFGRGGGNQIRVPSTPLVRVGNSGAITSQNSRDTVISRGKKKISVERRGTSRLPWGDGFFAGKTSHGVKKKKPV